jgi:hypothetical protein
MLAAYAPEAAPASGATAWHSAASSWMYVASVMAATGRVPAVMAWRYKEGGWRRIRAGCVAEEMTRVGGRRVSGLCPTLSIMSACRRGVGGLGQSSVLLAQCGGLRHRIRAPRTSSPCATATPRCSISQGDAFPSPCTCMDWHLVGRTSTLSWAWVGGSCGIIKLWCTRPTAAVCPIAPSRSSMCLASRLASCGVGVGVGWGEGGQAIEAMHPCV